ncbi:MAG: PKD domain-containing protein, partial [Candidatus Poseidoniales archaeon]|nr:PKD domain-containing protein [Candidatus Poseidoniales archaeon]
DIFDALDEELEIIIDEPIIEMDLLENLSKSAKSLNLPPIVDVGEDKTITSNDQGTAIVLLDGSKSYDPDGFIKTWSWENDRGKVISDKPQVNVKLSQGVHVFYLTVFDDRGASSRATLTIQII